MIEETTIITISDVLEYIFCPRFIYYMYCLDIPQHEEKRFKVLKGREVHEEKRVNNPEYLRKKLGVTRKETSVFLASKKHHIKGIIDEILFLEDGTAAPLEYKFAEYKNKIFQTYKHQLTLHALMIKENYNIEVHKGFICYTRSNNLIKQIDITPGDIKKATQTINEILQIIEKGYYPDKTRYKNKCVDCCYRNICV
jgi:CRISPR-associated exonuclease Cas4